MHLCLRVEEQMSIFGVREAVGKDRKGKRQETGPVSGRIK